MPGILSLYYCIITYFSPLICPHHIQQCVFGGCSVHRMLRVSERTNTPCVLTSNCTSELVFLTRSAATHRSTGCCVGICNVRGWCVNAYNWRKRRLAPGWRPDAPRLSSTEVRSEQLLCACAGSQYLCRFLQPMRLAARP